MVVPTYGHGAVGVPRWVRRGECAVQVLSLRHVAGVVGGTDGPALAPRKLRELRIEGDPHMRELPLAIDNLQHLKALSLRGCPRIAGLHLGLAQHTLQRLNICLCWELEAALPVEDLLAMPCLLELCTSQPLTSVRCCCHLGLPFCAPRAAPPFRLTRRYACAGRAAVVLRAFSD